jgi:UDP-glucose 4-epimerase
MRTILVTGGAGYIGSVCVERLLDAGHAVTVFDNLSEGHRGAVDPRADLVLGDLADLSAITRALRDSGASAVMHFAASALVGESMADPGKYFRNNVANGVNLLEAMVAAGVRRMVFSSSCATFGVPERVPIDESLPQRPINPYGESKLMFERVLGWYDELHGVTSVALRYFNAAGATERFGEDHRVETHLIPNVLAVALGKRPSVDVYGTDYPTPDGSCVRDYVHIVDLAEAHLLALGAPESAAYNLGTGGGSSVKEVIACCREVTGRDIPAVERPRRPGDPARLVASSEKIERELGWRPRHQDLRAIVESAWAWRQKHPDGYGD